MVDFDKYYTSQKADAGEEVGGWTSQMQDAMEELLKNQPTHSRIIDIGCYTGNGIIRAKKLGFENCIGIDLIKENVQKAVEKGVNALQLDMHNMRIFSDKYFDILFMSHAIEHSLSATEVLEECFRITKKGLIIFPIEPDKTTISNPPHYSTFLSLEQVKETVDCALEYYPDIAVWYEERSRLGLEVWMRFE